MAQKITIVVIIGMFVLSSVLVAVASVVDV